MILENGKGNWVNDIFTVKEIAEKLNISIDTLRYYDKIGLLSPNRGENKYRYYTEEDILKLQYVSVMKYAGFPLEEIKTMLKLLGHEPSENCKRQAIELLGQKYEEIQRAIHNYSNLLELLKESIAISENIDFYPEEHHKIDRFVEEIFDDIHLKNEKEV